jgi:hypothetical protein
MVRARGRNRGEAFDTGCCGTGRVRLQRFSSARDMRVRSRAPNQGLLVFGAKRPARTAKSHCRRDRHRRRCLCLIDVVDHVV